MSEIALRPNVMAKISGVVAYADPGSWTVGTLRPYVEHTIAAFGWDRVVWGSDWPVCTLGGGERWWRAIVDEVSASWPESERHAMFGGTAGRVYPHRAMVHG
jgi:predicted TIM-barrel fold metal-dependent hydrolase